MELKLLSHKYKVIINNQLYTEMSRVGQHNAITNSIQIDSALVNDRKDETLMHEILECIKYCHDLEMNHQTLSTLGEALMTVLKDNDLWKSPNWDDLK